MNNVVRILLVFAISGLLLHCAASKQVSPQNVDAQSSVKITMKDGSAKQGIVFKEQQGRIFYVDAQTHKTDTLLVAAIQQVQLLDTYYDFSGYEMPDREIRSNKGWTKTLLYGGGGLILGAAAGTGLSIALFAKESNTTAARITIGATSLLGATLFGIKGSSVDYTDAIFKTRKLRYQKVKAEMDQKKAELEELKRQKTRQNK